MACMNLASEFCLVLSSCLVLYCLSCLGLWRWLANGKRRAANQALIVGGRHWNSIWTGLAPSRPCDSVSLCTDPRITWWLLFVVCQDDVASSPSWRWSFLAATLCAHITYLSTYLRSLRLCLCLCLVSAVQVDRETEVRLELPLSSSGKDSAYTVCILIMHSSTNFTS